MQRGTCRSENDMIARPTCPIPSSDSLVSGGLAGIARTTQLFLVLPLTPNSASAEASSS